MLAAIDRFVDDHREDLVRLCADLVAKGSVNPPGDVRGPAGVLSAFLQGRGIEVEMAAAKPDKPNLIATISGSGPGPHLVFNGHLDTIGPGDEGSWTVPLYEMTRQGGRLFGLGIGNMKAGVAALALAAVFIHERRADWPGRLTLTAVADETVFGPDGAGWLLDARPELAGDALLCAEGPGFMNLAIAEKGLLWVEIEATSPPGQGMTARRGSGAIARLARVLEKIDGLNDERAVPPPDVAILAEHGGEHGLTVSANCGTVAGGQFISQVATRAVAGVDIRIPPGLSVADMESRIADIARAVSDVGWRRIKAWDPNWTPAGAGICRAAAEAAERVRGAAPSPVVRLPASDAARWRARGVPSVCYGPQPTLASGVDDYVTEQDVVDCAKIYALAALDYFEQRP